MNDARNNPLAPHPDSAADNQRETVLIDHLTQVLADRLADRSGAPHKPPWTPRDHVVVGVLPAVAVPPQQPPAPDEATADPGRRPVESLRGTQAPPVLALDFRVRTAPGRRTAQLAVHCRFALYLEDIASYAEHMEYLRGDEDPSGTQARPGELLGVWRRHDVHVPDLVIEVPLGEGDLDPHALSEAQQVLDRAVRRAVDAHFARPEARRPLTAGPQSRQGRRRRNVLPAEAMADEEAFHHHVAALLDRDAAPCAPQLVLSAHAQALDGGDHLIRVSLHNQSDTAQSDWQDLSVYDCRVAVLPGDGISIVPQRFHLAPRDYRLEELAEVIGRGTGCAAVPHGSGLRTETLPIHVQRTVVPRQAGVRHPRWRELADDPTPILDSVEVAMARYAREFAAACRAAQQLPHYRAIEADRAQFDDEARRFGLGRECLDLDPDLKHAFRLANEVFARVNDGRPYDSWRLFQLVYIVSHLPALAVREHPQRADLRAELDHTDVLWFPAGGGKTEAYLGLILTALFYDRLRGKHAGVTAWLRFPLRMLSVQQLDRTLRMLIAAEELRVERRIGSPHDDPFALGYLAGGTGSPNDLHWDGGWWRGWETEAAATRAGTFAEDHLRDRLVITCPYCERDSVRLRLDTDAVRLHHECTACQRILPLHVSDVEVYRTLPAIVISTVDKLTGHSWFPEFTAFQHGPRHHCAEHGYFSFPRFGVCSAGPDHCTAPKGGYPAARPIKDPVPALTVQDEMHLLKEELGAFNAHYEGLIAELQSGAGSGLPSKVLGASATIEQYQDQLRQLYGRRPRAFPAPGWTLGESFYTTTRPDFRRVHIGVLPHKRRKADVAAIVQGELLTEIARLQEEPKALRERLALHGLPDSDLPRLLFPYEVSLAYVNSKQHGTQLDEELGQLSDDLQHAGLDRVEHAVLTGEVPVPDLAAAIARVQREHLDTPRGERLRALVGTSVLSHGVDLERLNLLVLAGMPPTAADYIQVTARAGRTHAGLVVTVYDPISRRERSMFSNFLSYHRLLDRMVTPVPVNKYAYFAARRTLPGIVLALLHDAARDAALKPPPEGADYSKDFKRWWSAQRPLLDPWLERRIPACYRERVEGVNGRGLENDLVERIMDTWRQEERPNLNKGAEERRTAYLFLQQPLTSFRDIDKSTSFQSLTSSQDAFKALATNTADSKGGEDEPQP
ncbi:helicase-related protein [Streptomyces sp. NPDC050997]|uniref:helicase-related protein n=1 Tax=Streptomyces sp. NPDC050997 TaxID=3155519 RepID=UPI00344A7865